MYQPRDNRAQGWGQGLYSHGIAKHMPGGKGYISLGNTKHRACGGWMYQPRDNRAQGWGQGVYALGLTKHRTGGWDGGGV